LIANDNVTLDLATGDNNWVISVGYNKGFSPNYGAWDYPIVICSSFLFAIMLMLVLVSKKDYELILHKLMPKRAIAKLRKGETVVEEYNNVTIFFSDIVGYTRMASEMTPIEVMKVLNDLFMEFDKLAENTMCSMSRRSEMRILLSEVRQPNALEQKLQRRSLFLH